MDQIPRLSEVVYVATSRLVGTRTQVSIRREISDIADTITTTIGESRIITSGSLKEGFGPPLRSDMDLMVWLTNHHVIWDLNHADEYDTDRCTLILMECSEERPGFVTLQLLTPTNHSLVSRSVVTINDVLYISSSKWRISTILLMRGLIQHGPCAQEKINEMEYEIAPSFVCKIWPNIASSFTQRSQSQGWPPSYVLKDIINAGCHVVPIGFKGSPQEDYEWRISFSVAEKKLVCCMNHTQFLCYGLLKLFLKEVLTVEDTNGQSLLCSYFMKTVLFWVIQNNTLIDWNPTSLLSGFWLCFKFLLSSVYLSYLPNFFNFENNIFITKIFGHSQQILYERLSELYNLGIACLLHSHSLRKSLTRAICHKQYVISTVESDTSNTSEFIIDYEVFGKICFHDLIETTFYTSNTKKCFTYLQSAVRCLQSQHLSLIQRVAVRKFISSTLRYFVYHIYNTSKNTKNKGKLRIMYACLKLLHVSTEMGCFSDRVYLAYLLYAVGRTKNAIQNLMMIKGINTQSYFMYMDHSAVENQYIEEVGGLPLSEKMKRTVAIDIRLETYMLLSKELQLELSVSKRELIIVPLYVMTLMLLVLCYDGNKEKQREAQYELFILLHHDKGHYIPNHLRDISWHILGICQEICGDHQGALLSYQSSLKEMPIHEIQEATDQRMHDAQYRMLLSSVGE